MTDREQKKNWGKPVSLFLAAAGGFMLSFVGLGVLWIGTPWRYQFLMFLPFLLLSFAITRLRGAADNAYMLILYGAMPIGALFVLFRDKSNSHLMPILMVCAWIVGTVLGRYLANRCSKKLPRPGRKAAPANEFKR